VPFLVSKQALRVNSLPDWLHIHVIAVLCPTDYYHARRAMNRAIQSVQRRGRHAVERDTLRRTSWVARPVRYDYVQADVAHQKLKWFSFAGKCKRLRFAWCDRVCEKDRGIVARDEAMGRVIKTN
jgi:hypothetical protein